MSRNGNGTLALGGLLFSTAVLAVSCSCGCPPPRAPETAGSGSGSAACEEGLVLPVETHTQEEPLWCWAASASMLTSFLAADRKNELRQCDFANDALPPGGTPLDCCSVPRPEQCDRPEFPKFTPHGFSVTVHEDRWPSWSNVTDELYGGRPLGLVEEHSYGPQPSAHMFIATGCKTVNGDRLLETYDPAEPGAYWWHEYADYELGVPGRRMARAYYKLAACGGQCATDSGKCLQGETGTATAPACTTWLNVPPASPPPLPLKGFATLELAVDLGLGRACMLAVTHPESLGLTAAGGEGPAAAAISSPSNSTSSRWCSPSLPRAPRVPCRSRRIPRSPRTYSCSTAKHAG